ncbi:MAG: radical SAM protein [Candidatus Heimdallarchaeota archaeon]|nr:radical SAM protein [Candidatus Heimdallarchaeota archaeon]MBY8994575.1 radical SAM protein [Candidatus Heimdallarchaeota archaeon]
MKDSIKFAEIVNASHKELAQLLEKGRTLSQKHFGQTLKCYYPSNRFPSISITGSSCVLNCLHCNKHYLKNMHHITSPEDLEQFAINLEKKQGSGFLLSGGYNEDSIIPLDPYLEAISKIKSTTNLKINVHPGLVNFNQAKALAEAGVDAVSFDLITNDEVISKVIKNNKKGKDYIESFASMIKAGLHVVPHICLGLHFGDEKGNLDAIETALKFDIPLIVFLSLIPTKGTVMEKSKIIDNDYLSKLILYTRLKKPNLEQALGCMRVRQIDYERTAILAGINRVAVPKKKSLDFAVNKLGLSIKQMETCCSL